MKPAPRRPGARPADLDDRSREVILGVRRRPSDDDPARCAGALCRDERVASICAAGDGAPFTHLASTIARRVSR